MADPTIKGITQYEGGKIPVLLDDWLRRLVKVFPMTKTYSVSINPASVPAESEATETFTVTGLKTTDTVIVNKPTKTAGLSILDAYVSAADTLSITFRNFTVGAVDAGAETYKIIATRT